MLVLTVTAGPDPGRNLELSGDRPLIFGRFSLIGNEVDAKVSRRHALFQRDGHRWFVHDLGSRNGTFVNGQPIYKPTRLHDGDTLRLGRTVMNVALLGEEATQPRDEPRRTESPVQGPAASATKPQKKRHRPESPLTAPPSAPAPADFNELIAQELTADDSGMDATAFGEIIEDVDKLDESDLAQIEASAQEIVDGEPPLVADVVASEPSVDEAPQPSVDDAAVLSTKAAPAVKPGHAARGAARKVARPAQAPPQPVQARPHGRARGRRLARYAVLGVLLLVVGSVAALLVQSWGDHSAASDAQASAPRPPVEDPGPTSAPPAAVTPTRPAPAVASLSPPTPLETVARPRPAPAPSPPPPPAADTAPPVLDPYRPVDTLADAMGSAGRVSLATPSAAPPGPRVTDDATAAPRPGVAANPGDPMPDLPDTPPVVESQLAVVTPGTEAAVTPLPPEPPPRVRQPRPAGPRTGPASLDDADRVVFLVDASGSMIDTLPLVIQELDRIIAQLAPDQQFAVFFYQKDQVIEVEPTGMKEATRRNKVLVSRWMDPKAGHVFAVGPSYPTAAVKAAMKYQPDQIFLLADKVGASIRAKEDTQKFIAELDAINRDRAVQVNAVHFFYPDPNQALASVAAGHGGTYRFVTLAEVASDAAKPASDPLRDSLMLLLEGKQ